MKLKTFVCLCVIAFLGSLSPAAHAQTYSVIHIFTGGSDGAYPSAGVTLRDGTLYGTAQAGGNTFGRNGNGTVYQLKRSGSNWITTPLFAFSTGGRGPQARIVFGADSNLYGTTFAGGNKDSGVVFNLTAHGTSCATLKCPWKENLLYQFQDRPDGLFPRYGDLTWDQQGNIYGTTERGGQNSEGTVFELTPAGSGYTEKIIYSFPNDSKDGFPTAGVIVDGNGNLFGTSVGSDANAGKVFKLAYTPGVGWVETDLYKFQNGDDGGGPVAGLIMDGAGNLYGATTVGGGGEGGGTVFQLSPSGNTWTFKVLYHLSGVDFDACGPNASLTMDAAGNLYGTTLCDGAYLHGSVFKLTNTGNDWAYTTLHDFADDGMGFAPVSNVTIDTDGTLYGTALGGGPQNYGVVWMIKP